ncbi:ABC transporter ATP-binding protein [Butyricimonas paravirosa]|uniref:ABC transporter ATP-binding protein n=1 Tax=Butyricimonas paravirosa TaxID=1472417 RepID=UPI002A7F4127|nr:ATP-binding cassette domain-containing protein [Butyricimonas paravirosa]
MEEAIVKVVNLSHRYSVQWAIQGISFDVQKNGIQGLLGSNGAGKSTLMNIMCGVLRQTDGDVYINGMNTKDNPVEAKRFIGFLPQHPPLRIDLTVEEYLTYCAYLRWIPSAAVKEAVEEAMEKCKITHFRKRLIRNLSGGYQQRVGIAQAIIHKPVLVVLDEPTNGLDPNQIVEIRHLIKEIAEERTVILSTHMLTEVQAICDHIRMIEEGHLVFSGTVDEFNNYIVPNSLLVTLKQAPPLNELLQLEGIVDGEEMGDHRFRLSFKDVSGVVERLVETSVEKKWQLVEVGVEKKSLDAIFAELSKKK